MILLSTFDLVLVSLLVLALGGLCFRLQLGVAGQILIAALRCGIQLAIIGLVLTAIFATVDRLLPTRLATSSWVRSKSSISCLYSCASSIVFRSAL